MRAREATLGDELKPGTRSEVVRLDPASPVRTSYSVVYLHGLSASPGECGDSPLRLARAVGANLYKHRLAGHGHVAEGATEGLSRELLHHEADAAFDIGLLLGERVILLGSSLGASLALVLAARHPERVAAVVAWSPGIRARDPALLDELATRDGIVRYQGPPLSVEQQRYWSEPHADAYRAIRELFNADMTPATFSRVRCPVFLGYFYRDEQYQDPTASVDAMRQMFEQLGAPPALKQEVAYPHGAHVVGSPYRSAAAGDVLEDSIRFLRGVLELP